MKILKKLLLVLPWIINLCSCINQKQSIQNIYEYRIHKKIINLNNMIDKLNKPVFIYNKTEMN